jgi:hypothetical protein
MLLSRRARKEKRMDGSLILSLLLSASLVALVILAFQKTRWKDAAETRNEDCGELLAQLNAAQRECQQYKDELSFQKQYLLQIAGREMVCILNDNQAAQLINTVGQIVTQTKGGLVN